MDGDDQDEDGDELSAHKQKKFSFLPAYGASQLFSSVEGLSLTCARYNTHYVL